MQSQQTEADPHSTSLRQTLLDDNQRQNKALELVVRFAGLFVALMWLFVDLSWWLIAS
jgi:hypothetical protein